MEAKPVNNPVHRGKTLPLGGSKERGSDPLSIEGVDYIEIYSGNAKQAAFYYSHGFGFTPVAYRGPETGYRDAVSYVLRQGKVQLILTSPLNTANQINHLTTLHGDTVRDVAFRVPNCEAFFSEAVSRGAEVSMVPTEWQDEQGVARRAAIKTYGDVIHSIIERKNYKGNFWPGFASYESVFGSVPAVESCDVVAVDHVVGNVEFGRMQTWVDFYEQVLGFKEMLHFSDEDISTEYSALMSKVVANGTGKIKLPINEPSEGKRKSQIEEYLQFHNGPGVQHIALLTGDIIKTVSTLRTHDVKFLRVPETYYEDLSQRVGAIDEDLKRIAELGILVDRDDDGYLLQLFSLPVQDRPTLFFEVIQRKGSQGFGVGNFKALFEAIEREQARRGNL